MYSSKIVVFLVSLILVQVVWTSRVGVPVYVMLPLNTLSNGGDLTDVQLLQSQLSQLKSQTGIEGVMSDVWWGIVETQPQVYNWTGYEALFNVIQQNELKVKVTMSFHECGGNVGDDCAITLPQWVLNVGQSNPNIFYTDQQGNRDQEYLSLGVDDQPLFGGRTPIEIYSDYMASFYENFKDLIPSVIQEIQVGLGPAGEMRYPSYQSSLWTFPGIGEFQCYDKYMLANLAQAAEDAGNSDWGYAGPDDAGTYDSTPSQTGFFSQGTQDNYQSPYGQFFLNWYSGLLLEHGNKTLAEAKKVFGSSGVTVTAKVAGIHWWYLDPSHAAELAAGYKNDLGVAYYQIAQMFSWHNVSFDFTCLEMRDSEQPSNCECGPQQLVAQTLLSAESAGVKYSGENALQRYDSTAYQEIEIESSLYYLISGFSYLRLTPQLLQSPNIGTFASFVQTMSTLQGPN
ncbi:hypothetical protein DLAC_10339 [Tieghemostelium lacteum]|uniref:Beta-amylase n=1 Tax=Tieghemostelium lacteum TaxID=361077 RepID=A0A151Z5C2_TIELA|nr:hypothetical protein DLAC_10339 [Tieghemostelium lacteum]|eukprot:KYQ89107.1 hypothetical protein DLAC_10339 [Tieghemostelium lacteum]